MTDEDFEAGSRRKISERLNHLDSFALMLMGALTFNLSDAIKNESRIICEKLPSNSFKNYVNIFSQEYLITFKIVF